MTLKRLFFDVDGVLLNFEHAFVAWINDRYGLGLPEDYETEDWYFEDVLEPAQRKEAWSTFLGHDAASRMKPYVAPEVFNALTDGRPVHLLTNYPEHHFDKRIANLERLGFRYDSLHHCGFHAFRRNGIATKAQMIDRLLEAEEPALFVDDHPDNCLDVAENCPNVEVWLMSRRFNRNFTHPTVRRARDWGCVIDRIGGVPRADEQLAEDQPEPLRPLTAPPLQPR